MELWARKAENFAESGDSKSLLGPFTCRQFTTWDRQLYFPSEGRRAEDFFARKIRQLRPALNPRTRVPKASTKGDMEVARKRGRRRKKLLDDLKDRRGYSHLKEEALDRTIWRHRSGGGFGPVVRQNIE